MQSPRKFASLVAVVCMVRSTLARAKTNAGKPYTCSKTAIAYKTTRKI